MDEIVPEAQEQLAQVDQQDEVTPFVVWTPDPPLIVMWCGVCRVGLGP
jgi:hypothetical protein